MFIGHYGIAFAAKKAQPRLNLAVLFLAAQFLDTLWPFLLLAGVERVQVAPGDTVVNPLQFTHYPYSHSLAFTLLWAALFGLLARFAFKRSRGEAWLLGGLVLSHWLLDLPFHKPDLPLLPQGPLVGFGLWNHPAVTFVAEYGLFFGGLRLYWTRTAPHPHRKSLFALAGLLAAAYALGFFGPPPPPNTMGIAVSGIVMAAILLPWAWWTDRSA